MKIIKRNVREEEKPHALDILNKLRSGSRVFGKPAQGLRKTLSKLEESKPAEDSFESSAFHLKDNEYEEQVAKLKKGIKGEEQLAQYFEKIIRLDRGLSDIIVFASLGEEKEGKDYIPDTDFLCIYGNSLLAVDAKAINTKPDIPIFVQGDGIYSALNHNEPILEVNPSTHVWQKILASKGIHDVDISGCVCIINRTGCEIFKDNDWQASDIKPIHISELVDFLLNWIKDKDPTVDLHMLTVISEEQILEAKSSIDLSYGKRVFGV